MKKLASLAVAAMLAVSLGGCASNGFMQKVETVWSGVTGATVTPQAVLLIASTYDALEVTAKNYLKLPICGTGPAVCASPAAIEPIINAIQSGRVARNNLKAFQKSHPNELGPKGLYDAVSASIDTIHAIFTNYGIK